MLGQQLPVDPRLVVVALEVAQRGQAYEVGVALIGLSQKSQVCVALLLRLAIVGDVDLAADDGLHAVLARLPRELDRPGERAVVGERHGRHLESRRLGRQLRDPARPVENRILGVDMQMDEGGGHREVILEPGQDRTSSPGQGSMRYAISSASSSSSPRW